MYRASITFLFNSLPVWEKAGALAYKPGLDRIMEFTDALGRPQEQFKTIHVAGTNGKGSVCHMLAAVMQASGRRTGLFTSPHLVDFRERIRVDGEMIPESAVVEFTERWKDRMVQMGLTFFEMATAMALWWFREAGCEVAVVETGLGGRLDSTNIINPMVSVITNVGLEHTQYLGDTIAKIAAEKAGIIKSGVPVVVGERNADSEPVFRARAAEAGAEIVFADARASISGDGQTGDAAKQHFALDLSGGYQHKNVATALAAVEVVRRTMPVTDQALKKGLAHAAAMTGLRGRWQVAGQKPLVVLDTAHNAHGMAEAVKEIERQSYRKLYMVLGFAADKDLDAIMAVLPRGAHYTATQAASARAMSAPELARRMERAGLGTALGDPGGNGKVEVVVNAAEALSRAMERAGEDDMVFVGGSNFVVGEVLAAMDC